MKFEKNYCCTIFCAFCVFILSIHGKSECLVLEGEAKLKRYSSEGRGTREVSYEWSVVIDQGSSKWMMTVDYPDKGYRYKLYHDSINCYSWFYKYDGKYNDEGEDVSGVFLGEIVPGGFPYRSLPVMQIIWLGYCAENYIKTNSDSLPPPWISMFSNPLGDYLRSEISFRSNDSDSYEKIYYYVKSSRSIDPDDFKYFRRETITYGESQIASLYRRRNTPWHKILKDGSLAGELQRSEFVRVKESFEVSKLVKVEAYSDIYVDSEKREDTKKGAPYAIFEVKLNKHEIKTEPFTSPELKREITVTDYRISDRVNKIDFVAYNYTDINWVAERADYLNSLLSDKVKESRKQRFKIKFSKSLFFTCFISVMIISGYLFLKNYKKNLGFN